MGMQSKKVNIKISFFSQRLALHWIVSKMRHEALIMLVCLCRMRQLRSIAKESSSRAAKYPSLLIIFYATLSLLT